MAATEEKRRSSSSSKDAPAAQGEEEEQQQLRHEPSRHRSIGGLSATIPYCCWQLAILAARHVLNHLPPCLRASQGPPVVASVGSLPDVLDPPLLGPHRCVHTEGSKIHREQPCHQCCCWHSVQVCPAVGSAAARLAEHARWPGAAQSEPAGQAEAAAAESATVCNCVSPTHSRVSDARTHKQLSPSPCWS